MSSEHDQEFERGWWGNCANTLGEELKQLSYAKRMGIKFFHNGKSPYYIDAQGKRIIDIGGGPVSLLLKCENLGWGTIVDPCDYPEWVAERYKAAKIYVIKQNAEDIPAGDGRTHADEVWIYNCLQHVIDPEKIIQNARQMSKLIRIFEWIDNGVSEGHPHDLTEKALNIWLGGTGKTEWIDENTAKGHCFYGVFKGNNYDESQV